jgi:Protein of unknown function (DUF2637)
VIKRQDLDVLSGCPLATVISVVLLAVIAAVVSFGHTRELALRHGEAQWSATLIPLSVDGMVVAASMSVLLASKSGGRGEWLPWALLIVGSLASLAANVAVADATVISRLIAAWPSFAFAFVGAYHLRWPWLPVDYKPPTRPARWAMALNDRWWAACNQRPSQEPEHRRQQYEPRPRPGA